MISSILLFFHHINIPQFTSTNPLREANEERLAPQTHPRRSPAIPGKKFPLSPGAPHKRPSHVTFGIV